jgi:hypothetical protein
MGKKKSVVLLTLLTIVIVVLCAMVMTPSFELPFLWEGAVSNWNPVVKTYDLSSDLGGGYYTYYYPEGVISETEYKTECASRANDEDKLKEYQDSYLQHGGLYLSTDPDDGVLTEDNGTYTVNETFKTNLNKALDEITARYRKIGYSAFRVSIVDDYALKVELPASASTASTAFTYFAYTGEFTLSDGTDTLLEENENKSIYIKDYFKSFSVSTSQDTSGVAIKLTSDGRDLMNDITTDLADSSGTLYFKVGDENIISLTVSEAIDSKSLFISGSYTYESAQIVATLLDSAINAGDLGMTFTVGETRTNEAVYGSNALTLLYIALAIVLVAAIVIPFVKYKGFGGVCLYSTLSYLIITTICFAFITSNVFEVTLGTALIFLLGLLVTLFMNGRVYEAVKEEVGLGKTVESSVKAGYKKTLAGMVDTYAVLILAAIALLIGGAGVHTLALQALICFVSGAFISLLWSRFINCMLVSIAKDKYKYYGLVREDDDDE